MPSDTQNNNNKKREFRLPLIMAGGLFFLLTLVSVAMLTVTYISSQLIVENEDGKLREKSGVISNLVAETRLEALKHSVDLISEDRNFSSAISGNRGNGRLSYLTSAFYTQRESTIDVLILLSNDGKIRAELSTETFKFPEIMKDVGLRIREPGKWHWSSQKGNADHPKKVLLYYKREILNTVTGKIEGHLVGGVFVNSNRKFVNDILSRTGAEFVALLWNDEIVSSAGRAPAGLMTAPVDFTSSDLNSDFEDIKFYVSNILGTHIQGAELSVLSSYPASSEVTLSKLLVISSSLALFLALLLSLSVALLGRKVFLNPLKQLITYARKVERHEGNLKVPVSAIKEFNEVGHNLENVFSAFQESETRFRDFVSVSTDSVWETDKNDRYVFLSREINAINEVDMNRVLGKKRWEVEGVDQNYGDWEDHWKALINREPFKNFVFRRMDTRGRLNYWSVSGKPRFDKSGEYSGYRGTSSNITGEIEAQLEAEKMEEKLRQSQKLEVVGQLTGGVAHDFNNLLSVVMGNLELIEEKGLLEGSDAKHLSDAIRGAERGAALTHQLLAYSRQQALSPTSVQPSKVIDEMSSMLDRVLGETVRVKTILKDSWPVLIDPAELENALLNLAINAKDAMPSGGELTIESFDIHLDKDYVETLDELKAGDYVCVVVADTGEGISKDILDRILEPFFTTKEVGKGSGLGLSMVYGFVKQSGGHISVYSEMGLGTSIQLYLPRAFVAEEQKEIKVRSELIRGNNELVLVVEDNVQVRQLVVTQLKSLGYETLECEDGHTAISILENEPVDFLLSDVTLPLGLSGLDIVNFAQEQYENMPKLLMSGFTGDAIRGKGDLPENVDILYKPFTKLRLSEAISHSIKQRLKPPFSASAGFTDR